MLGMGNLKMILPQPGVIIMLKAMKRTQMKCSRHFSCNGDSKIGGSPEIRLIFVLGPKSVIRLEQFCTLQPCNISLDKDR